ncbi:hypothetical protein Maq22A_1p38320 (plasmid) [Methylobacterium aquaticum]|uniref:Uncharacterized protein n=1 Tax=Methylobacterium aquaticum TaxID=270351 RepID=A0A1Y0ZCF1_9HYPH|nr:hypothetical protein Maq22A_1p38320 [Methylobacterium aquaticum]
MGEKVNRMGWSLGRGDVSGAGSRACAFAARPTFLGGLFCSSLIPRRHPTEDRPTSNESVL